MLSNSSVGREIRQRILSGKIENYPAYNACRDVEKNIDYVKTNHGRIVKLENGAGEVFNPQTDAFELVVLGRNQGEWQDLSQAFTLDRLAPGISAEKYALHQQRQMTGEPPAPATARIRHSAPSPQEIASTGAHEAEQRQKDYEQFRQERDDDRRSYYNASDASSSNYGSFGF
jgi:hypothetical protein